MLIFLIVFIATATVAGAIAGIISGPARWNGLDSVTIVLEEPSGDRRNNGRGVRGGG